MTESTIGYTLFFRDPIHSISRNPPAVNVLGDRRKTEREKKNRTSFMRKESNRQVMVARRREFAYARAIPSFCSRRRS